MMENFKVTLDRIEDCTAVLLLRDDESIKIDVPLFSTAPGKQRRRYSER